MAAGSNRSERTLQPGDPVLYTLDRDGVLVSLEAAAGDPARPLGRYLGRHFTELLAPEYRAPGVRAFREQLAGAGRAISVEAEVISRSGARKLVAVTAIPLREGDEIVGLQGAVQHLHRIVDRAEDVAEPPPATAPALTPRQLEVLSLLAGGATTDEIAGELGIARETARNHIRAVLLELGAHSRLQAVSQARRLRIIP